MQQNLNIYFKHYSLYI